jgi:hypothetical protein
MVRTSVGFRSKWAGETKGKTDVLQLDVPPRLVQRDGDCGVIRIIS